MMQSLQSPADMLEDPFFERLKSHVIEATGLSYYATQDTELARHLSERLAALRLSNCGAYWILLRDGRAGATELDLLIAQLTIGETFFFRHVEQFNAIRDRVLPEVIERNQKSRALRIWSAGCATGAEPYSIAILLKQFWPEILSQWDVTILGTDINRAFLDQARQGRFGDWALRATPVEVANACFVRSGADWILRPECRRCVSFDYHNLVQVPYPSVQAEQGSWDIILCRNVMIYFSHEMNRRIVGQFRGCIADDGWLVVGHAESNTELFQAFETVNAAEAVLYRKTATPRPSIATAQNGGRRANSLAIPRPEAAAGSAIENQAEDANCRGEQLDRRSLDPEGHLRHALLLQERGRLSEAEKSLRRAIYLDRKSAVAHYYLGLLLKRRSELKSARRCFRNVLRLLEPIDRRAAIPIVRGIDVSALTELARSQFEELKDR